MKMRWMALFLAIFFQKALSQEIPIDSSYSLQRAYEKEVKRFPHIRPAHPELPQGILEKRGMVYSVLPDSPFGTRELRLNIFYHARGERLLPGVLLVHGGGWRSGNFNMPVPIAQRLASRGYVTATVEYRLSREAQYPAAVHDLKAAIRWLRANAQDYGLDPSQIAIMGFSAGGQLAALTATTNNHPGFEGTGGNSVYSSAVQALIDIDGIIDFLHPESQEGLMAAEWLGGSSTEKPDAWKEASALTHAGKDSPPTLFIGSQYPRFLAGHKEMIRKLDKAGIYTEVHYFSDTPHPFWLFHPWFEPTVDHTARFLDKVFKNRRDDPPGDANQK